MAKERGLSEQIQAAGKPPGIGRALTRSSRPVENRLRAHCWEPARHAARFPRLEKRLAGPSEGTSCLEERFAVTVGRRHVGVDTKLPVRA